MKKILFFMMLIVSIGLTSCYDKIKPEAAQLDYAQLYECKTAIEQRLDECPMGESDGQYPEQSFEDLKTALAKLKEGIKKADAGLFILQFEVDNYVLAAQKAVKMFDDSKILSIPVGDPAELFVNGVDHKGYIDFGSSPDYNSANITIETWTKYPENFIDFVYGSFISTFISPIPYKGWAIHYWGTSNSLLRFSVGTDNANPDLTLPTIYTSAPTAYDKWFHVAAVFSTTEKKMNMYIDGELKASQDCTDNMVAGTGDEECRMWAFVEPKDHSRCVSGYIKKFRIWSSAKTQSEIKALMTTDVNGSEVGLVCAWDFTVKPEDDTKMVDKTGKHTAKLVGVYKWKPISNE